MVNLIRRLMSEQEDDGFNQVLSERFDTLVAAMNVPDAAEATQSALFADPTTLSKHYSPGTTETCHEHEEGTQI